MIKKLIIMGILTIPLLLSTCNGFAQVYTYEEMPREVKDEMNLNKQKGLSYWNDIIFTFHVSVEGLEKEEYRVLLDRASNLAEIISVRFENNLVIVECTGGTNFDKVKSIFSSMVSNISGIENRASIKRTEKK